MPDSYKPIHRHPSKIQQEEKLRKEMSDVNRAPATLPIRTCQHIVEEANRQDKWIYDPDSHEWYSPDEFNKAFEAIKIGNEALLARVQIKHPTEGIEAGHKVITKMQDKWYNLVKRVIAWRREEIDPDPQNRA